MNFTMGPNCLILSLLLFGTMPNSPTPLYYKLCHLERFQALQFAISEIETIITENLIKKAL